MTVITMSRTEIDRMSVLHDLADGRIRIAEASTLMGLGRRQVFRLAKAYGKHGPQALVSRRRGRPSNRCYPTALRGASGAAQSQPLCFAHQRGPGFYEPSSPSSLSLRTTAPRRAARNSSML